MLDTYRKVLGVIGIVLCLFSRVFAYSGGSGEPNNPYQIATVSDWNDLMNTSADWNKHFILIADVNLQGVTLTPVGVDSYNPFAGIFDGNDHIIRNAEMYNGLFGYVSSSGQILNLGLEDINITGGGTVGGLVVLNYQGSISNCYSTGTVMGISDYSFYIGGLVGGNSQGTIRNCYSTSTITGEDNSNDLGGLVGGNSGSISNCCATGNITGGNYLYGIGGLVGGSGPDGNISNSYSTGAITGGNESIALGGLVGGNDGSISNCYSTGAVTDGNGSVALGGLIGSNDGNISNCYSTGIVSGSDWIGGLVGYNYGGTVGSGTISNCYSTGAVTGENESVALGGLVGGNADASISNCYSAGAVIGSTNAGGLVGLNDFGTISASFWDVNTSGQTTSAGGEGKTTTEMQDINTFLNAGWDFSYTDGDEADWFIQIDEYPILTWQISPADIYTDGKNNFRDFAVFAQYWMREDCAIYNYYCDWADLDFNGSVDIYDLIEFMSYWLEFGIYN